MDILGQFMDDCRKIKRLSREEQWQCARKAKAGDIEARNALLESVIPLIIEVARKTRSSMEFLDRLHEGFMAALHAIDKFDPDRKIAFSTWVVLIVSQKIRQASVEDNLIRVPSSSVQATKKLKPETAEKAVRAQDIQGGYPRHGDYETCRQTLETPESEALEKEDRRLMQRRIERMTEAIDRLKPRWRAVVYGRMEGKTLEELAQEFGLSRERIRQIQAVAHQRIYETA